MFRVGASRLCLRSVSLQPARYAFNGTVQKAQLTSVSSALATSRTRALQAPSKSVSVALMRRGMASKQDTIDKKHEEAIAHKKISAHPEYVSATSSTHPITGEVATATVEPDIDMLAGVKSDIKTIRETFSLEDVPKQAYYLGMAGVLPYFATSMSTVFCAWEINRAAHGSSLFLSERSAELLLQMLEPLQIGYGAVIISFLGAIHWGLEWANYGAASVQDSYRRYAIGVFAPAAAWPTTLLPPVYALTSQFVIFTFLYYADSRASKAGLAPAWYGTYRFILTFLVGASIVVSLISKGEIADKVNRLPSPLDRVRAFQENAAEELALEEEARVANMVKEDEK